MLTPDDARRLANAYRPRFRDDDRFRKSWDHYMDIPQGLRTAADLERWLVKDLDGDRVASIGSEPLRPVIQQSPTSGCYHCYGRGFVRKDVDYTHPDFGKALVCPACQAGQRRCLCQKCGNPRGIDHARCIDLQTGHDFEHPEFCPRCLASGVKHRPLPKGIDHVGVLAGQLERRP